MNSTAIAQQQSSNLKVCPFEVPVRLPEREEPSNPNIGATGWTVKMHPDAPLIGIRSEKEQPGEAYPPQIPLPNHTQQ